MTRYVALLRGVNVGGKNALPMKELAAMFGAAGCVKVTTYIQSGNVIFEASGECAETLSARTEAAIAEQFGIRSPVILRTAAEIRRTLSDSPFDGAPEEMLHVYFLREDPAEGRVKELDQDRSTVDSFAVRGREIYLLLPAGMARTKLTNAYFDRALDTVCTARSWKTVRKLAELVGPG